MKHETKDPFNMLKNELLAIVEFAVQQERMRWLIFLGVPLLMSISLNAAFIAGFIK